MKKIITSLAILFTVLVLGQSADQNYVKTTVFRDAGGSSPKANITYFDGLGRPIEQVAHQQSTSGNDIVTPIEYDAFGRQVKEYLPMVSGQTLNYHGLTGNDIINYYTSPSEPTQEATQYPYSEKELESSPLNRVFKQAAPGASWRLGSGHEVKFRYETNSLNEVRLFRVSTTWNANLLTYNPTLVNNGNYYDENKLYKTITIDENKSGITEEFKDKEGKVILKRTYENDGEHSTYYVYDDFGNLTYVFPPIMDVNSITQNAIDDLGYQYKYDDKNRLVAKKLPGKQWEYIAYNSQDMPVATGPTYNPFGGTDEGWMITKYDVFGRVVYTGWYNEEEVGPEKRVSIQVQLGDWAETVILDGNFTLVDNVPIAYTNETYPTTGFKLLTVNYYDHYNFPDVPSIPSDIEGETVANNVKTLATGSWVRVLDNPNQLNSELTVMFYDVKSRVIRTHKANYLAGFTQIDSKLDFMGKPLYTITQHTREGNTITTVRDEFKYDSQDRLFKHSQRINNLPFERIVLNEYDELGQLIKKSVGGLDAQPSLQVVDYRYNIRGWLKSINNIENLQHQTDPLDLFAFKIAYDDALDELNGVKPLFNGNISETYWRTSTDNIKRKYGYIYDDLNRLRKAVYQKPDASISASNMYNEEIWYDKGGNISMLNRNGDLDSDQAGVGPFTIDNLFYTYHPTKKNQLMKVWDESYVQLGFKDDYEGVADNTDDYTYDANGNMKSDTNKLITNITYNHLNLPTRINFVTGQKIEYLYDATGRKVKKTVQHSINNIVVTDYLEGYQYTNIKLDFFPHSEGYVNVVTDENEDVHYNYVYQYKDHLGNIRVNYSYDAPAETVKILEENHYYPFGLKHTNYNTDKKNFKRDEVDLNIKIKELPPGEDLAYKYKYNGKEFQDELGLNVYDYGARNYDPALGRWMNIDPLAEKYFGETPYNYVSGNPIVFIDPHGMDKYFINQNGVMTLALIENKPDILYSVNQTETGVSGVTTTTINDTNKDGETNDKDGITFDNRFILSQFVMFSSKDSEGRSISSSKARLNSKNKSDYFRLFKFISDNSLGSEYSLNIYNHNSSDWIEIATYHLNAVAPHPNVDDSKIMFNLHNHSDTGSSIPYERGSMGADSKNNILSGDSDYYRSRKNNTQYTKYVYFGISKRLYGVTQWGVEYIKMINKSEDFNVNK